MPFRKAFVAEYSTLPFVRTLLALAGFCYLGWYFSVEWLLPNSYNPLAGRLFIVGLCFLFLALSFFYEEIRKNLYGYLQLCLYLITLHYFYLFHHNPNPDWILGCFVTVIATNACVLNVTSLFGYSLGVFFLSLLLCAIHESLARTIFLPGLVTILVLANLSLRSRLKLVGSLRESSRHFFTLFNSTFEGICIHDRKVIVDANQAFASLFGYSLNEIIGKKLSDLVSSDSIEIVAEKLKAEAPDPYEVKGLRKDGSQFEMEIWGRPWIENGQQLRLSAHRDVSGKKLIELERIRLQAAEQAVQIRDEFISIASHELKTPLTSLKLQTQFYLREMNKDFSAALEPVKLKKFVDLVNRQSDRLTHLVENMLDVSRISRGKLVYNFEKLDLTKLAREVFTSIHETLPDGIPAMEFKGNGPAFVEGDRFRLEQVFLNLLTNAVAYGAKKPILMTVEIEDELAIVTVRDQGIGIASENLRRIFERFERAISSKNISGLGLGLYISKHIVEEHHGKISVTSELGQGSCFTVSLPRIS